MSDLYYSPLDNLLASPNIKSPEEVIADNLIQNKAKSINESQNLNSNKNNNISFDQVFQETQKGCHNLIPIDCKNPNKALEQANQDIQKQVENSLENILNASKPGYHKKLPYAGPNGQIITDETPGPLQRTNWQFDLGISGLGKGFKLINGEYTRDGRFKFDKDGKPVTINQEIPLQICYEEGAPIDWSLKNLKIDFDGKVYDKLNGQLLGKIESNMDKRSKILQYYIERSNVNLPLEFMGLQQKLRLVDLNNNVFTTGAKLDSEALQTVTRLF